MFSIKLYLQKRSASLRTTVCHPLLYKTGFPVWPENWAGERRALAAGPEPRELWGSLEELEVVRSKFAKR